MRFLSLLLAVCAVAVCGCRRDVDQSKRSLGIDAFVPQYNRYIQGWLKKEVSDANTAITALETKLAQAAESAKDSLTQQIDEQKRRRATAEYRLGLGDYFSFKAPSAIPADLVWENGMDEPEVGDPAAKKGGVFRKYIDTFPPTIRPFGPNSNHSFRGDLYDLINMQLVSMHPETQKFIPGLAKEWAVSADNRTAYFRLDPEATYSNGEKVKAKDYLVGAYIRVSDCVADPFSKQYYRESMAQITVFDDYTIAVTLPEPKPMLVFHAGSLPPACPSFYSEYGPDYAERYQWRFPPTTGAYEVLDKDIVKGVSITQSRVKNWWAKDRKYYRYCYNPDQLMHRVVRDRPKAFELFRAGEIDAFLLGEPQFWYEKSEMQPVYKGYIEKVTFYNQWPRIPRGLYFNTRKGILGDRNVRVGIQYAMNWDKVIDVIFRGDASRAPQFTAGYGRYQDPSIKARPFDVTKAREAFQAAGYTQEGPDGILRKPDGTRLKFSVTFGNTPLIERVLSILREDAKQAGLDLVLDGQEDTVAYKKTHDKLHECVITGWGVQPPMPRYFEYLHSTNALDEKGNLKPDTNNVFSWSRQDTDLLCAQERNATTEQEFTDACWKIQRIMHDEAIYCPGWAAPFARIGYWRWVKWPNCETTKFCTPVCYEPMESFVYWIDEEAQKETRKAMQEGKSYPEKNMVYDQFRDGIPAVDAPLKEGESK